MYCIQDDLHQKKMPAKGRRRASSPITAFRSVSKQAASSEPVQRCCLGLRRISGKIRQRTQIIHVPFPLLATLSSSQATIWPAQTKVCSLFLMILLGLFQLGIVSDFNEYKKGKSRGVLRNTCETLVLCVLAAARLGERLEATAPWQLRAAAVLPLEGGKCGQPHCYSTAKIPIISCKEAGQTETQRAGKNNKKNQRSQRNLYIFYLPSSVRLSASVEVFFSIAPSLAAISFPSEKKRS